MVVESHLEYLFKDVGPLRDPLIGVMADGELFLVGGSSAAQRRWTGGLIGVGGNYFW